MHAANPLPTRARNHDRTQTVEHLFVDEMHTFNDLSHTKHIVRRSTVCKGAIIVGAEIETIPNESAACRRPDLSTQALG